MSLVLSRTSVWSVAALLFACQSQEAPDDKNDNGSGAATSTGATAGMPSSGAGMDGTGTGGSAMGVGGSAGTPALGGMAGAPAAGTGAGGASVAGMAGAPAGGIPGMTAGDGGAPAAGMSAGGAGAGGAGTAGETTAAGTGGTETSAGTGGMSGMAGMSGTGGTPGTAHPCPDGCAELSVPFTAYKAGQYFEIYLNSATNLSTAVISVKARKIAGKAGGLLIVVKDGSAQNYAYAQSAWNSINDMTSEFSTFMLDVAAPSSSDMNNTFDPAAVQIITVQIAAGDPWYTDETETMEDPAALLNPTVIQIDEISIAGTGTLPGPWPFTSDVSAIKASISDDGLNATPPYAVAGSTVTWVGP